MCLTQFQIFKVWVLVKKAGISSKMFYLEDPNYLVVMHALGTSFLNLCLLVQIRLPWCVDMVSISCIVVKILGLSAWLNDIIVERELIHPLSNRKSNWCIFKSCRPNPREMDFELLMHEVFHLFQISDWQIICSTYKQNV